MRPRMAVRVLSAPRTPAFSGLPSWMRWMKAATESMVMLRGEFSKVSSLGRGIHDARCLAMSFRRYVFTRV